MIIQSPKPSELSVSTTTAPVPPGPVATSPRKQPPSMSTTREFGLWLAIVCSVICPFLDETIVATAIPEITNEFGTLGDSGWYGSAYLMTMSASQLIFGRLYSNFNPKKIFLASLFLFEAGSLICATSATSHILIFGRALSGIGAAGLYSGVMALFVLTLPAEKLPLYVGAMGTIYGVAAVLGPIVGGVITNSYLTWRWCFYINLPVAVPPVIAAVVFIKIQPEMGEGDPGSETRRRSVRERLGELDYLGMGLLVPGITCTVVALEYGGNYSWDDGRAIWCFVAAGVLIALFIVSQWWMGEKALLSGRIVNNRLVFSCAVITSCIESCFTVMVYYLPMWFQTVQGASAGESGIRYLAICIPYCLFEVACGWMVSKIGYVQPFMLFGSILISVGGGLLSTLGPLSHPSAWIGFQVLAGMGVGASTDHPGVAVQRFMNDADAPLGFATILFCQNLGPTIALSIAQAVFIGGLTKGLVKEFPGLDSQTILNSGATTLRKIVPPEDVPRLIEIYNHALTRVFYIVAASAAVGVFAVAGVGMRKLPSRTQRIADATDSEPDSSSVLILQEDSVAKSPPVKTNTDP